VGVQGSIEIKKRSEKEKDLTSREEEEKTRTIIIFVYYLLPKPYTCVANQHVNTLFVIVE
jgi:hypothetical protein